MSLSIALLNLILLIPCSCDDCFQESEDTSASSLDISVDDSDETLFEGLDDCKTADSSILRSFLPSLPLQKESKVTKGARVLTSIDNLKLIEEKEQKKLKLIELKEMRKQERERKAVEREKKKKEVEERKYMRAAEKTRKEKEKEERRKEKNKQKYENQEGKQKIDSFTEEEHTQFLRRLENDCDIPDAYPEDVETYKYEVRCHFDKRTEQNDGKK